MTSDQDFAALLFRPNPKGTFHSTAYHDEVFLTDARDSCRSRLGWVSGEFFACKVSSDASGVV